MTEKVFADGVERDDNGWLLFPRDVKLRAEHFVSWKDAELEGDHPAKANLYLTQELYRYTTELGDTVMDITAGSGSIMLAALEGRRVVAIDLAEHYMKWMKQSRARLRLVSEVTLLMGDCRDFLPIPVKSIVFSPPYSVAMNQGGGIVNREKSIQAGLKEYSGGKGNLGSMNDFIYNRAMQDIYKGCFDSLESGGYISLLIKDRISKGERVPLGFEAMRLMDAAGFVLDKWDHWKPPGSQFVQIHKAKGDRVVEDESIIICRKL